MPTMLLHDHVDRWAARRPDAEFAVQGGRRTTWAQARDASARAAGALRAAGLAREPVRSIRHPEPRSAAMSRSTHGHRHLAVALHGTGWHSASWREPGARPDALFSARYWIELARTAERGLLDLVAFEDTFGIQAGLLGHDDQDRTDQVRGRLDAMLTASFVAPLTGRIGLVPTVTVTHTEPFHVAKATATLDHTSHGRAGWRPRIGTARRGRAGRAAHGAGGHACRTGGWSAAGRVHTHGCHGRRAPTRARVRSRAAFAVPRGLERARRRNQRAAAVARVW